MRSDKKCPMKKMTDKEITDRQGGAALILALLTTGLLAALGVSLLFATDVERQVAANASYGTDALAAAEAAVERGLVDLRTVNDWTPLLNGRATSAFAERSQQVSLPAGGTLDLTLVTADVQAESSAHGTFGANTPVWRLVAWGPLWRLAHAGTIDSLQYLAVWVADDPSETDGNPQADSNGILEIRGEARGPGGSRRVVEATVTRVRPGVVRMLAWREVK